MNPDSINPEDFVDQEDADVSVSGTTFKAARELLIGASITTLACKGKADFVLFPEISACVNRPWSLE